MSSDTNSYLSAHAVWRMLEESGTLERSIFADAEALAAAHERTTSERVIGVAMNLDLSRMAPGQSGPSHHPYFDEVLFGMRTRARIGDFHLLLLTTLSGADTGLNVPYLEICRERRLDGIFLVSFPPDEPGLVELVHSELPCVAIDTHVFGPRSTFVISDNVGGSSAAVHHLAELGRRRIAFIGGTGPERASTDRRLGYESALAEVGLEARSEYIVHAHWNHAEARAQTRRLLELREPPDAIFCASDVMAIGVLCALEEAGLRAPEDVAVVGFDDSELARLVAPSLTSVRQDMIGLGTTAVEAMLQILDQPEAPLPAPVLPVQLEIRESSAGRSSEAAGGRARHEKRQAGEPEAKHGRRNGRLSSLAVYQHLGERQSHAVEMLRRSSVAQSRGSTPASERRLVALATFRTPDQGFRHAFFDDVYCSIRANAFLHDIDLLTFSHFPALETRRHTSLVELCQEHGVEGVIVVSLPYDDPETAALADSGFPCVAIDIDLFGKHVGFVMSDNVDGGARRPAPGECGRRRIAFIGGRDNDRASIDRRFGYQSELEQLGIELRDEYVVMADWSPGRPTRQPSACSRCRSSRRDLRCQRPDGDQRHGGDLRLGTLRSPTTSPSSASTISTLPPCSRPRCRPCARIKPAWPRRHQGDHAPDRAAEGAADWRGLACRAGGAEIERRLAARPRHRPRDDRCS